MEYQDIMIIFMLLACCGALWAMAGYADKVKNSKWRLCWLIPPVLCLLLTLMAGFEKCMIGAYHGALILVLGLVKPEKKSRRLTSLAAAACALVTIPVCLFSSAYRRVDYAADFKKGFERMKTRYVLSEHKNVDWDGLYAEYLPLFEEVTKSGDEVDNQILWDKFCAEFHDLHVGFTSDNETYEAACKRAAGNDYGLVIVTLADGRTVAANVDDSLSSLSIHNGTEIVSWNGMTPAEADELSDYYHMQNFSDEDNRKFYEGFFAAGMGGDTSELVYIDDNGAEQSVVLSKLSDDYYTRFQEVYDRINKGLEAGHMSVTKLNGTTACLRIKSMLFDTASEKDNHAAMQKELREKILSLKEEGVRDIVIDIRENNGGSGTMVRAIAQLFAPEGEHYYVSDACWDNENKCYVRESEGVWKKENDVTFQGENILGDDGRVVLLVTARSVSAADHMTKVMTNFDNTTVIGFTEPAGSAQGVASVTLKSGSLAYSAALMLNEDGTVFVDSGTDLQADDDVQIKVPFDEQAFQALFDNGEDYLLDYSLDYLANMER